MIIKDDLSTSVIICTYSHDRWEDLVAAVESLKHQTVPALEIVVVVDHNDSLLRKVQANIPEVIAVANEQPKGLSGARNSGIAVTKGHRLAFLDDDATAEPDWLEQLNRWCDEPHVMGAGGKVLPVWKNGNPAWFPEEFYWVIGCTYRGMPETATEVRNVFGGCMCLLREGLEEYGYFRSGSGRVDNIPFGCEETELCIRARKRNPNQIFVYEPQAVIHHYIPAGRIKWSYFFSRCYHEGLSKALLTKFVGAKDGLASERTYTLHTLPQGVVRGIGDAIFRRDLAGAVRAGAIVLGLVVTALGYLLGLAKIEFSRFSK